MSNWFKIYVFRTLLYSNLFTNVNTTKRQRCGLLPLRSVFAGKVGTLFTILLMIVRNLLQNPESGKESKMFWIWEVVEQCARSTWRALLCLTITNYFTLGHRLLVDM